MFRVIRVFRGWELNLLFPELPDDGEHGVGVGGFFEVFAEIGLVQKLGDVGERVEMLLKLTLGNEEDHDELDRLVIERVEVHAGAGSAEGTDDFVNQIRGGVRDPDAEANAGGH